MNHLILASGSPRRRELLSLYTTDFTVCVSDFDESAVTAPTPAQLVEQLAIGKCLAVAKQHPDAVVIGCDTWWTWTALCSASPTMPRTPSGCCARSPARPIRCTPACALQKGTGQSILWTAAR